MNKLYKEIYPKKVFTLSEANKIIKNYQACRNTINRLSKQKLITKLKAGIYYINPLDDQEFYPDTTHIATKLRPDAIITSSTALKAHKLTDNTDNTIYITSKHPSKIRIGKYTYRILKGYNFGIDNTKYQTPYGPIEIKITDIERTIIDCIKTRSIKGEELIKILIEKKPEINMKKMLNYLEKYNMPILYSKTGLILETCKTQIKLSEADIEKIHSKLTKKINYYKELGIRLVRPRYQYNKEWNIMIPETLSEKIRAIKTGT
ncbi:MAG: type IV toxin-antitoxin system AbiEi family antitoxin domain-containing protein [Candidatus Woesearchaeota archaeon]